MNTVEYRDTSIKSVPAPDHEPEWMNRRRRLALEAFNNQSLPQQRLHLWRYTDPSKFIINPGEFTDTISNGEVFRENLSRRLNGNSLGAAGLDLSGRQIWTSQSDKDSDLVVMPLSQAFVDYGDIIKRYIYQLVNEGNGKFEAFASALWQDGLFVYLPDGKNVEKPVHLMHEIAGQKSLQFFRLLVVVGKNSEITLIDEYSGGSTDNRQRSYAYGAVEIFAHQDSRVRYINLQRQSTGTVSYLTHRAIIDRGASMLTIPLALGGALSKQNFGVTLNGPGASSKMYGMLFGSGKQHFDNHTLHHHASGRTTSDIDFKVILRDKSVSAYTGLIEIERDAANCEAYQENRNLLLNDGARAETIPELEIHNEEVMCTHGATVGPIDPEMIFYLTSRGIPEDMAVRAIVTGFVASTLKMVPADIRGGIGKAVSNRLEGV